MRKAKVIYVSGGVRSGKSSFAQDKTCELTSKPIYLATAPVLDDEFKDRVRRHQEDRDEKWRNFEEEFYPSKLNLQNEVILLDCVTLWLYNWFHRCNNDIDQTLDCIKKEWAKCLEQENTWVIVSNEIGMGLHAETKEGRLFTDLQGWVNQHIAQSADEAVFMVSGLPLKVK